MVCALAGEKTNQSTTSPEKDGLGLSYHKSGCFGCWGLGTFVQAEDSGQEFTGESPTENSEGDEGT